MMAFAWFVLGAIIVWPIGYCHGLDVGRRDR